MYQPSVFCVKLQLHFGGDVHEISVPAYGGAEPTVNDLMNVVEQNFRVPRVLQNLVFHGQDLHTRPNEPLSRFGIRNGVAVRLVGRMAPPDQINQINAQYNTNNNSNQQSFYPPQPPPPQQQQPPPQQPNYRPPQPTVYRTTEQDACYYSEQFHYAPNTSVGTQYDPPLPPTPQSKPLTPATPSGSVSERPTSQQQAPPTPATPKNN